MGELSYRVKRQEGQPETFGPFPIQAQLPRGGDLVFGPDAAEPWKVESVWWYYEHGFEAGPSVVEIVCHEAWGEPPPLGSL